MKLRKPCQHDLYDPHIVPSGLYDQRSDRVVRCPGGVFLPDDTLIISGDDLVIPRDDHGNWPMPLLDAIKEQADTNPWVVQAAIEAWLEGTDALSVRETPEVDKNQMGMW